jgi:hypothetical protein
LYNIAENTSLYRRREERRMRVERARGGERERGAKSCACVSNINKQCAQGNRTISTDHWVDTLWTFTPRISYQPLVDRAIYLVIWTTHYNLINK